MSGYFEHKRTYTTARNEYKQDSKFTDNDKIFA